MLREDLVVVVVRTEEEEVVEALKSTLVEAVWMMKLTPAAVGEC